MNVTTLTCLDSRSVRAGDFILNNYQCCLNNFKIPALGTKIVAFRTKPFKPKSLLVNRIK